MPEASTHATLFRQQALVASRERWLGDLQVARPPGATAAIVTALCASTFLLLAITSIQVPERIAAAGVLLPAGKLLTIRAPRSGIVQGLRARNGQTVGRGQSLLEISGQPQLADNPSVHQRQQDSLRRELAQMEQLASDEQQMAERHRRVLGTRIELAAAKLHAAHLEMDNRTRQVALEAKRAERASELGKKGVLALERVDEQVSVAIQAQAALHVAEQGLLGLREQLALLQEGLQLSFDAEAEAEARTTRAREALQRELLAADNQHSIEVTAADDGEIQGLMVREGASIAAGQQLMTLIKPDSELNVYIYVSADDAGRVLAGQHLELELRAFPAQRYGTLGATVVSVSQVPVPAEQLATPVAINGPVFELHARLVTSESESGLLSSLSAGATFRADLIVERWALYQWLLRV